LANEFAEQSALDREELNILWWVFSESSATFGDRLDTMATGKAAVTVGAEIANMALLPPSESSHAFIKRGIGRIKKSDTKKSLEKFFEDTDAATWKLMTGEEAEPLCTAYPILSPLAWLASKLSANNGATGWGAEFKAFTGLDATLTLDPYALAEQVFLERIAERLYQR
jgi:hypothetical protein